MLNLRIGKVIQTYTASLIMACWVTTTVFAMEPELIQEQSDDRMQIETGAEEENTITIVTVEGLEEVGLPVAGAIYEQAVLVSEFKSTLEDDTLTNDNTNDTETKGIEYDTLEENDTLTNDFNVVDVEDYSMYTASILNVRSTPNDEEDNVLGKLTKMQEVEVVGDVEGEDWVQILYDDETAYVNSNYLTDTYVDLEPHYTWGGQILNAYVGTVNGPSGKETYYNLDMSKVVSNMKAKDGYDDYDYWVRSDGAKMFGPYIMVAADLNIHPRGSIVETSMGEGIVVDTGDFIYNTPVIFDVATVW